MARGAGLVTRRPFAASPHRTPAGNSRCDGDRGCARATLYENHREHLIWRPIVFATGWTIGLRLLLL
jgi:hypothetical protein